MNHKFSPVFQSAKKEQAWEVEILCNQCNLQLESQGDYAVNQNCFNCMLHALIEKPNVVRVNINYLKFMPEKDLRAFQNFRQTYHELKTLVEKKEKLIDQKCFLTEGYCPLPKEYLIFAALKKKPNFNEIIPLISALTLQDLEFHLNRKCNKCLEKLSRIYIQIYQARRAMLFQIEPNDLHGQTEEESSTFARIMKKLQGSKVLAYLQEDEYTPERRFEMTIQDVLNEYWASSLRLYNIKISRIANHYEKFYSSKPNFSEKELEQIETIRFVVFPELDALELFEESDLGNVLTQLENTIKITIKHFFKALEGEFLNTIATYLAVQYMQLHKIFPFLLDNYIEEIFLDSANETIYLNHQVYGRCRTNVKMTLKDLNAIKTHLRLESRQRLDRAHSSIVYVIQNKFFNCRFSIDVQPIHYENIALDIRKMNKKIFTLIDLIQNKTISLEMAAWLYFCTRRKINITTVGETDSGKTTLINALDLLVPPHYRKVYLEDAIESLDQRDYGMHQLKYVVAGGAVDKNRSKSAEIKKLLHRTPDIVYLGEILTKEECNAMFHCLSAGLRGFQTTHAYNIASLVNRWNIHFSIPLVCFNDLGLVISMKKHNNRRRVLKIVELQYDEDLKEKVLFEYLPQEDRWELGTKLYSTRVLQDILDIEHISEGNFVAELRLYEKAFSVFLAEGAYLEHDLKEVIAVFGQIDWILRTQTKNPIELSLLYLKTHFKQRRIKNMSLNLEESILNQKGSLKNKIKGGN